MGLLVIITKGRWSVMTLNYRQYKYVWNRCIPNMIDKSSRAIQAYRYSVGVILLLAYGMGLSSPSVGVYMYRNRYACKLVINLIFNTIIYRIYIQYGYL